MFRFDDGVFCSAEKAKLEETHAQALKREQDEVTNLKSQLADIAESHKAEMDQAASEKSRLEEEMQKLREAADTSEKKAELAQAAAGRFQTRIEAWTEEFRKMQDNMHGKPCRVFECSRVIFFRAFELMQFSLVQQTSPNPLRVLLRPWLNFGRIETKQCQFLWPIGKSRITSSPSPTGSGP